MGSIENHITPNLSEEDEGCLQATLLSTTLIFPFVLNAAIELDLFSIIAGAGLAQLLA